ncbi:MAG: hypothetical protein OHK0024_12060 [Thalassobaculales bacterium]
MARGLDPLLTAVLDNLPARVVLLNADGTYRFANRRHAAFLGQGSDALEGASIESLFPARFAALLRRDLESAFAGETVEWQGWMDYPLQGRRFVRRVMSPLIGPDGAISHAVLFVVDVTEQRQIEDLVASLDPKRERGDAFVVDALDAISEGIAIYDPDDRLIFANAAYRNIYAPVADTLKPGMLWRDHLMNALAAGLFPDAAGREQDYVAERIAHRGKRDRTLTFNVGGRWLRATDRRTRDGGLISIRADVSEMVEARRLLEGVMDAVPGTLHVKDARQRYLFANRWFCEMVGRQREELLGRTAEEVFPGQATESMRRDEEIRRTGEPQGIYEVVYHHAGDGTPRTVLATKQPLFAADGAISHILTVGIDITGRKQAEQALADSETLKAAIIDSALDAIISADRDGRIIDFNPAAEALFGYRSGDVIGRDLADVIVPPHLREDHRRGLARHVASGEARLLGRRVEIEALTADGRMIPVELTIVRVPIGDQPVFTAHLRDIGERRRHERQLYALAYIDTLTGLPNRARFLEVLSSRLGDGAGAAVLSVHLDRFPALRNSWGHRFAEEALIAVAQRLDNALGARDMTARVGDVRFAVLLAPGRDPLGLAEELAEVLRQPYDHDGRRIVQTVSIGVATAEALPEGNAESLLRDAEIASYRQRERGGDGVALFDPAMHARVLERMEIEHDLRRAIAEVTPIQVAYQPIIDLAHGRIAGFEALARWHHPQRGEVPAARFVEVAEQTGQIGALGRLVLRQACAQVAQWQRLRPADDPLFVSVNLSPIQLGDPGLPQAVREALADGGCHPSWLKLEITETAVMRDVDEALRHLAALKEIGIRLSIDDFGVGQSSLTSLHKLPLDTLKVDRSFIVAMHTSLENREIVRIIIDLAQVLKMDVVAEGVESDADVELLRNFACRYGQGYHFARPLDPQTAGDLIAATMAAQAGPLRPGAGQPAASLPG